MPKRKDIRQKGESLDAYLERLKQERAAAQKESLNAKWGEFLDEVGKEWPWDWYCTFTFSDPKVTPFGAHHFVRRFIEFAGKEGIAKPYAFRADEYGPQNGRFHSHALIGNVSHLIHYCGDKLSPGEWGKKCCWMHRWPCGIARIRVYEPQKGANYYISKYVTKALGDWEFVGFNEDSLRFKSPLDT